MSTKPVLNGRKPVSEKVKQAAKSPGTFSKTLLDIPANIKAELSAKGLEGRWISFKQYADNYGYHKNNWAVFKSDSKTSPDGVLFGNNPDGIIRRGDLVLAARPMEQGDEHRAILAEKARIARGYQKAKAEELRQMAKDRSVDAEVYEGYEDNG